MSAHVPIATNRSVTGMPTGRLALWWVIASETIIFGGLLVCYLMLRLHHGADWGVHAEHTNILAGFTNTVVLLTSSLFIVIAHQAAGKKDTKKAFKFIWLTIAMGGMFLVVKSYEYTTEISHGYTLTRNVFWSFYFVATGLHGFHVTVGMIIMGIISFAVKKGENLQRVEYIGIYWHFVDLVWIFLFPLLYIAQ